MEQTIRVPYLELLDPVIKKMSTLMIQYGIISIIITIAMITIYVVIKLRYNRFAAVLHQ